MTHDVFLLVLSQLAGKKKTRVVVQGSVIFIETCPLKEKWTLSTPIFSGEGRMLPPSGFLRWQEKGAYLKLDPTTHTVYLMQDVLAAQKYVPFKYLVSDFADVANEWREILDDFSQRDHTPTKIERNI